MTAQKGFDCAVQDRPLQAIRQDRFRVNRPVVAARVGVGYHGGNKAGLLAVDFA